jgi:hypothetical protein
MCSTPSRRGLSLIESAIAVACLVAMLAMGLAMRPAEGQDGRPGVNPQLDPRGVKDAEVLRALHQVVVIFSNDNEARYPTPGLINRLPDAPLGNVPGFGDEDVTRNTTANLYSCLIAQAYLSPDLLISPIERNPKVTEDTDYNYDAYQPSRDTYWDATFAADLEAGSNVSYAHPPIHGERKSLRWRNDNNAKDAAFSNRGPKDGAPNADSHTCSPHGLWAGWVVFRDNHSEFLTAVEYAGDNLFANDPAREKSDLFLTFTKEVTAEGFTPQWD